MISGRNYLIILMYIKEKHTNIKYKSIQMHINICIHTHIHIHMKTYKYIKIYETQEHTNILFFFLMEVPGSYSMQKYTLFIVVRMIKAYNMSGSIRDFET